MAPLDVQYLPLPCSSFQSLDEYTEFRRQNSGLLNTRWLHERSLAVTGETVTVEGTCGVCLRPSTFLADTAGGEIVEAGRMPNWRETLVCNCGSRLIGRERAVLQFALGNIGLQPWYRVLMLDKPGELSAALQAFAGRLTLYQPPLSPRGEQTLRGRVRGLPGSHHMVLALDILHRASSPSKLLDSIAAALVNGGNLIFTLPFHSESAQSKLANDPAPDRYNSIGWDILRLALNAGFRRATAHLYWSEEFGYLGVPSFIFSASR